MTSRGTGSSGSVGAGSGAPYGAATYGDRIAEIYDDLYQFPTQTEAAVDLLAELAGPGPALELGIGTGRLALPLAARGVTVLGIDASDSMVAKLRAKPGGSEIDVTIGDFSRRPRRPAVPARLRRLQHLLRSAQPGRPAALLRHGWPSASWRGAGS